MSKSSSYEQLVVPVGAYDYSLFGKVEEHPLDNLQRMTAYGVTESWKNLPQVTHHEDVDVTDLEEFRQSLNRERGENETAVSLLSLVVCAVAKTLQRFPEINASFDTTGTSIIHKFYYNIGIAVDTSPGLMVPVIRDVVSMSPGAISEKIVDLATRAHSGKLQSADVEGGTFTITNLGKLGGTGFSPIINAPEAAILGLSRIRKKPVVRNGEIVARHILPLSMSYDHRIVNGAQAARFMCALRDNLESAGKKE
jgi:pyruvate dehydrogenase E2 component (dihydrolipoamide acetyltransferase)